VAVAQAGKAYKTNFPPKHCAPHRLLKQNEGNGDDQYDQHRERDHEKDYENLLCQIESYCELPRCEKQSGEQDSRSEPRNQFSCSLRIASPWHKFAQARRFALPSVEFPGQAQAGTSAGAFRPNRMIRPESCVLSVLSGAKNMSGAEAWLEKDVS
jgi:hypothetical protein